MRRQHFDAYQRNSDSGDAQARIYSYSNCYASYWLGSAAAGISKRECDPLAASRLVEGSRQTGDSRPSAGIEGTSLHHGLRLAV
jgi:hypothetical protein